MKKILFAIILILTSQLSLAASKPEMLNYIVAKVNDQIITSYQLEQRAHILENQLREEKIKLPSHKVFYQQVLQNLINEKLQLQLAKRANIFVSDIDVEHAIDSTAKQQHLTRTQLINALGKHGISYSTYVKNLKNQLVIQKLQREMVVSQVTVSPEEINSYLRSATHGDQTAYLYHVEDILIGVSDTPTPAELQAAKQKADDVMMQLQTGTDFRTLAVANSSGAHALKGGDLGWRALPELPTIFAQHLLHMKTGDLAGPIRTPNGYHIIHLLGIKHNPKVPSNNSIRERLADMLYREKVEEKLQTWLTQLRDQAYIKVMTH